METSPSKKGLFSLFLAIEMLLIIMLFMGCGDDGFSTSTDWGMAEMIETDNAGDAGYPRIAMDEIGDAKAVWAQSDGTRNNIWANSFDGTNWGSAEMIETDNIGDAFSPQIAMNETGIAMAVWYQSDGTRYNIWANRFDVTNWGTAEMIETDNIGDAFSPQIAMNETGIAMAVWYQSDGTRYNIWANRFDVTNWGTAEMIETDNIGDAFSPQIAMNETGIAMAVWYQSDGTRYNIWTNRFDGTNWGAAEMIESDNAGGAFLPQIAMNETGIAMAVWYQSDGTRDNIWANRFDGTNWGSAEMIEIENAGYAQYPQIAMDKTGDAMAVWHQSDGTRYNIWANRFDGTNWGTAELIETDNAGGALFPQIAMGENGDAMVVWYQSDGTRDNIWANRFDGANWGTAEMIETDNAGDALYPKIAMDETEAAMAVWHQSDGTRDNIWANRFE